MSAVSPAAKKRQREYQREWQARQKAAAHAALGGKCAHCGFTDPRALQIDHVNGDASSDLKLTPSSANGSRKRTGDLGSYYRRVAAQADSGKYQLLCANCNWIKRVEQGEHTERIA